MVARGAGAAGPVLLACRQWDPLGLARRLPSLGVGAWRCAPLLPWRVQCPVCVCAALAAGSEGSGRYLVLCLSLFPLPAPRVRRCVWRAVPSGCPFPSLAGTPFHVVCAFRTLGPVALLVVPACPFRVCALALSRCPLPPPWVVWRAHLAWSRHWALVGPFHVVRAPPRVLFRSLAPSGVLGGGAVRSRFPPTWLGVVGVAAGRPRGGAFYRCEGRLGSCAPPPPTARPLGGLPGPAIHVLWARACGCGGPALSPRPARPVGAARRGAGPWRSCAGGRAGGGGGVRRTPQLCGQGGACRAGGRSASFRPSAFPGQATKRVSLALRCPWGAWPPIPLRFVLTGYDLCGVLARRRGLACSSRPPWGPAAGAGGRVALRLLSRAGGDHPPCRGGWGPGPQRPAGRWVGGGGAVAPRPHCSPSGRRPAVLNPGPLRVAGALPSGVCMRSGPKCCPGVGGVRGGQRTAPLGALADLNPPSALPEWAVVTGGSRGARPPYCSVVRVAPARQCGLAGAGPAAAPPTASPPRLRGGGGPRPWLPGWGGCGEGGGGVGGPLVPWRCLLTAGGGGGMAVLAPGASHRLGGRALPPPPST